MDEQLKKLFDALSSNGYYTKSFEDFKVQFADSAYQDKVFGVVSKERLFTKSKDDFINKYASKKKEDTSRADTGLELESGSSELPKIKVPEVKTGTTAETDVIDPEDEVYNKAGRGEDFINFFSSNIDAGLAQGNSTSEVFDIMKSGSKFTDQEIDALIDSAKEMDELPPSEEMIKFTKAVEDNGGDNFAFLKTLADFDDDVNSYKVLAETGIRSLAGMIKSASEEKGVVLAAGGVGLMGGPATSIVGAMSAAGGLMETSVSFIEFLKEELGGKEFTRENISDILNDEEKRKSIRNRALIRGGTTALFDLIGGALATKTAGAVAKVAKKTTTGLGKTLGTAGAVGTAGVVEGVFGGAGEATARLAAGQEYSAIETGLETFGGSGKGMITGPLGIVKTSLENTPYYKNLSKGIASYELNGKIVNKKDIEEFIDSSTPEEVDMFLRKTELVINNDSELSNKIENKRKRFKVSKDVVSDPNGKNTEKIIDLEVELDGLKNKKTESSKNRRNQIKEEIKNLQTEESPIEDVNTDAGSQDQLQLLNEDNTTFEKPDGSELYIIGKTQRTVALVDSSGKLLGAFDAKTGKKRKTTASSESELIKQVDYNKGKSAFDGVEAQERETTNDEIASSSENPKEVAVAFMEEKNKSQAEKAKSQKLFKLREDGDRFTLNSLIDLFVKTQKEDGGQKTIPAKEMDKFQLKEAENQLKKNFPDAFKWVAKNDQGINIEDLSDYNEVWELIKRNPPTATKKSVTETNLKERFKELTGLTGTDSQIEKVAEQDSEQLMEPREPAEVQEEREDVELQREAMEKEGVETEQGAKNLIESLKKWAKLELNKFSNLRSKIGLDPKRGNVRITRLQEAYKGGMKSETYAALSRFQNIETLIKKLSKNDQDRARVVSDKILRGEKVTQEEFSSFEEISKLSSEFRLAIDELSQELIDLGILPSDSEQNISDNIGEYLNRAYLAFTDPNYKPDDITRQKAKRFLQKNPKAIIKQAKQRAEEEGISLNKAIAKEADIYLDSLLEKDDSGSPMSREFKLNKSILKQKKGVPKPLREFLGEIKDGRQAAYISHLKLASLVNTARYQKGVLDSGLGKFIYEKNDPNRPPNSVEIKGSAYDILSGYYASPDVVDAIIPKQKASVEGALKVLTDLNGLVKGWKTVYNPTSYLRNYISTMVMLATRGDLSMKHFIDSHKAYLNTLKGKKVFEEKMFEYKKMGIVGQNIDVGVIKSAMRDNDTDMETGLYKRMTKKDDSQESILRRSIKSIYKLGKLGKGIQFTAEKMQTIFQAGDDIGRMMAYEKRKEAHADMMFDKTVEQLDDSELKQVQEAAAEEIKDQYNNYDRVPPLIKELSRNILVGSFVQFPAEMIRNTANTIGSTITRMKDKNPKVRKDAKTRLATFLGAQSALVIGTTFLGNSIMDMFNMDDEDEDDVQRVKDLRNVVAPWSKNHKIILRKIGDNKLSYIDVSANNPYNMISRLIQKVGIDGIGNNNDTYEVMFDFFGPFLDQEILISSIQESVNGQTESGKPLFFDTDGLVEKFTKGTEHILTKIMPGYMRFVQRVTDEDKSTVNELISLTGFRTTEVDLDTSLYFKMRAAYSDMQDIQASYRMNLSKGKDIYDDNVIKYGEAITKANEVLQSHIRLGLDPKLAHQQMKKMMGKNQKFSNNEINAIIYGVEIPFKEAKK